MVSILTTGDNDEGSAAALRTRRCRVVALHLGDEQHVPKLPRLQDPQHEAGVEVGVDRAGARAQPFDELEPEIVALVVVDPGAKGSTVSLCGLPILSHLAERRQPIWSSISPPPSPLNELA